MGLRMTSRSLGDKDERRDPKRRRQRDRRGGHPSIFAGKAAPASLAGMSARLALSSVRRTTSACSAAWRGRLGSGARAVGRRSGRQAGVVVLFAMVLGAVRTPALQHGRRAEDIDTEMEDHCADGNEIRADEQIKHIRDVERPKQRDSWDGVQPG